MKITYNRNPLKTVIELDDQEKQNLWYKIKINEMEESMSSAYFYLDPAATYYNIEKARNEIDPDYFDPDEGRSKLDERVDLLLKEYVTELQGSHCGDCTCVPCSCMKCHAESILGINTLKGLGKHHAYKIDGALNSHTTIAAAIASLENYEPKVTDSAAWEALGGWEQYAPRWKAEAQAAAVWLKNYHETYTKELP